MRALPARLVALVIVAWPSVSLAQLTADDVLRVVRAVHDAEGVDLVSTSTREQRIAFWLRAIGVVHHGHPSYNPTPDPRWCVKDAGGGRPPSDDVVAMCTTRQAWDLAGGAGGNGYLFQLDYLGVLPTAQNIYPPPVPAAGSSGPVLAAGVLTGASLTLTWQPPTIGAAPSGYTVVARATLGGPVIAALPVGLQTTLTVSAPDGRYYVRVLARINGTDVASNEVAIDVGLPLAPGNLIAVAAGSVLSITWNLRGGPPPQGYVLQAGSGPGLSDLAVLSLGNVTAFVSPPVPDGSYYLRVRARNGAGVGPASAEMRAVVGAPPPLAPTLSATATAGGPVTITWTVPSSGAVITGYRLDAGRAYGNSDVAAITLPAGQTVLVGSGVPAGTYYLRVVALSTAGPGAASNEVVLVVP